MAGRIAQKKCAIDLDQRPLEIGGCGRFHESSVYNTPTHSSCFEQVGRHRGPTAGQFADTSMNPESQPRSKTVRSAKRRSGTRDEGVYAHIFDAILEQRLAPATKLSEEALGAIFGVSRTVIRRALSRLGHEGVVLLRPNRGAVVASPTADEARQIFYARRMIERAITELACERASATQIAELRQYVAEEHACFVRGDRGTGIRLSGEFHLKLAEVAGNVPLIGFLRSLISQSSLIIALYEKRNQAHCSDEEHLRLIDAIEAHDADTAVALMMRHMDSVDDKLNFEEGNPSDDLQAVFSHLLPSARKSTGRG